MTKSVLEYVIGVARKRQNRRWTDEELAESLRLGDPRCRAADNLPVTPWMVGQCSPVQLSPDQLTEMAAAINGYLEDAA